MRAGGKRKELMDGACPKDAWEQVTVILPNPECKNPPKSVLQLGGSNRYQGVQKQAQRL
jgi:hypothetical protein